MTNPPSRTNDSAGFKSEFFADLFEVESRSFWFRCRNRLISWGLKHYFPHSNSFLEIGCGTGFVLAGLQKSHPTLELTGSELMADGLKFARRRLPGVRLLELDARNLHMSEEFDVIGAFDVLEHIEEDQQVLGELWKATRQGVILTVPQHKWLWSAVDDYSCHKRRYTGEELRRKLGAAGFEVFGMTSFVSVLLPLLAINRLRKKSLEQMGDPMSDLRLPLFVDRLFEAALDTERFFIELGLSIPWGGSLFVVARKRLSGPRTN